MIRTLLAVSPLCTLAGTLTNGATPTATRMLRYVGRDGAVGVKLFHHDQTLTVHALGIVHLKPADWIPHMNTAQQMRHLRPGT